MDQRPASDPDTNEAPAPAGRLGRLYSATRRPPSPRLQRATLVVAAVVFFVGGWFAFRSLDITWGEVRWIALVIAADVGVPLTLLANTLEYLLSGRMLHH